MTVAVLALLLQAAAAVPAGAAPPPAGAAPPPAAAASPPVTVVAPRLRTRPGLLFISPAGEPFRGVEGDAYPVGVWFAQADADHDGKVSRSEFRRDALAFFAKLDINHDGVIDASEITRYEEVVAPEVQVSFGAGFGGYTATSTAYPAGDPASSRTGGDDSSADHAPVQVKILPDLPRGGGRYGLINSPEPVVSADTDLNRRITAGEFSAAADRRFALLDPQEVGYLALATLPKTPIQARGEPRKRR